MTSQMNTKVRYVICPRCWRLLRELAEVSVYKCGGCGTILQAKNRKQDSQDTGARVHEANPTQKNDVENVSEHEKATILSTYESDLDKISEKGESGMDCKREWLGGGNQSNESPCSDVISCHGNASSSLEARAHMEVEEDKFPSEQCGREDRDESRDDGREHSRGISISTEISSSSEFNGHENESSVPGSQTYENESLLSSPSKVAETRYSSENKSDGCANESENCDLELPLNTSFSKEVSSSDLCTSHEIEDPSQLVGVDREVDEKMKSHSIFRSPSAETFLDMTPKDQISSAQSSSSASVSADNLTSPCTESKKQACNGIISGFQSVSSVDTLENMPRVYSRSDLGVTLRSSTAKNYYAYDAGASSSYETNDREPNSRFHPLRRNFKVADSNSAKRLPERDEFTVNHALSSESELQQRRMNSSSILRGKKHPNSKESKWHQDEFLEPTRYRHPVRSMMRMETHRYQSGPTFHSKGSQAGNRNGSYGQHNLAEMPCSSLEADKLELLRMVYELQDQVNKMQILKGVPHGRFSTRVAKKGEQISSYNDYFAPQREKYPGPNCYRYPGRYSLDVTWFQQGNQDSRMAPFSGHNVLRRHQVNCLCLRCRRQERYYLAQLPPPVVGINKGHSKADPRQNYYRPYHPASSSPQHYYTPSEFSLWSRDTKSDDQMHSDHEVKKKHPTAKQHFLPIAGGAPIIACYRCSEMLQLPADFLLFKKKCHRLRCSACSRVLKFSLEMKTNLASASRATDCPRGEPVSFSDDYGQSFCRSCSTEGDHFPLSPPFETANRISDRRKMSSSSSLESKKEGNQKSEFPNKNKNRGKTFDAAGAGHSSEIEELSPSSGSQLHRLMGYSSPSRLIYKYSDYSAVEWD